MASWNREIVVLMLQFLKEANYMESMHRLEKESGFFFNTEYFGEKILAGEWDEVETYLSGFTKLDDNGYSTRIFFEIRKQKYLEALDRQDRAKAVEILYKDLAFLSTSEEGLYKEMTLLLILPNFRLNQNLSTYGDIENARSIVLEAVKRLIEANPLFHEKLIYPTLRTSRLRTLISQSLNWQHSFCNNPRPNPHIKTLFTDHTCPNPNGGAVAANAGALANWMADAPAVVIPASMFLPQNQVPILKRLRTPPATPGIVDYENPDHERTKRLRPAPWSLEDLPTKPAMALHQGSTVTSMDFHPMQNTLLLVGSVTGEITLWELSVREKLVSRPFKIWDTDNRTLPFQVESHAGAVNDLAFANLDKKVYVVTCGDDRLIKVWDVSGWKQFITFEGHDAPVYSVCPHQKENNQCTTMLYSADGTRLFSCGKSEDGDSFLVEWNDSEVSIKRKYFGCSKKLTGAAQFDSSKNHFLAVGEDGQIKFWDMDKINVLTSTDAEGGLPALPRLRFNKEGDLLAVSTADEGFKILANEAGFKSLGVVPVASVSSLVRPSPMLTGVAASSSRIDESADKPQPRQLAEILDPSHCRQVTLPDTTGSSTKDVRLLYMNSGVGILALGINGIQRLWKWVKSEENPDGKATTTVAPQLWQPDSGVLITNDVSRVNLEGSTPCMALAKNDLYVMSAVGGTASLLNMLTFKVMKKFLQPPPASTILAFHPQDHFIIAIGMDDSMIRIQNLQTYVIIANLNGHKERITGLSFSTTLNILVSSGADAQLSVWSLYTWEKRKSVAIQMPAGKPASGDTRVQFHVDQIHVLAVHETQLAIFDASKMNCVRRWIPQDSLSAPISSAVFACNSKLIYTAFRDGNIGVFDADSLRLRCRISPSAYFPQGSQGLSPLVVAANPKDPNQFAIALNDGSIKVIEPTEAEAM
ncbi:unnamed protein product [Arabis nemorensis]|uniref:CTLH domain-containing protein n=1 Tax=Arabis nemorensis TaxID=586526 RepID=A0A565CP36_9BRAS|nr:unnamed protein product [Arabis nemorensis]